MCYSIYAWHGIVLNVMVPSISEVSTTFIFLPLFLGVTFVLAALSYRYIEFGARENWRALFFTPTLYRVSGSLVRSRSLEN